jgi:hypothetical protein
MQRWVSRLADGGSLLAINLLFLTVWACASIDKIRTGVPPWFADKFGQSLLASFPGLTFTFWILAASEFLALALALIALVRLEFLTRTPLFLRLMLVWSLFVFTQLSLGQWLTSDFNAAAQLFAYFAGTLLALVYLNAIKQ